MCASELRGAAISIYATLRTLTIDGETILVQGVPGHIAWTGPDWDWLGPPATGEDGLRAIFLIDNYTRKGTLRSAQEYQRVLLTLTPDEYVAADWVAVRKRVRTALIERNAAMWHRLGVFEDFALNRIQHPNVAPDGALVAMVKKLLCWDGSD